MGNSESTTTVPTDEAGKRSESTEILPMDNIGNMFKVLSLTDKTTYYDVSVHKNTCSCLSWRYRRQGLPTCKHLDLVRPPLNIHNSIVVYVKNKDNDKCRHFQTISSYLPKCPLLNYVYAQKFDGIRVRFRLSDKRAVTRKGGMIIDISTLTVVGKDADPEFDAELIHRTESGHAVVMRELTKNTISTLTLKVFDVIDETETFTARQTQLREHIPEEFRVVYQEAKDYASLSTVLNACKENKHEGIVVRHKLGMYMPGRSKNTNAFKIRVNNKTHTIAKVLKKNLLTNT